MSAEINTVIVLGKLQADPEWTKDQPPGCTFRLESFRSGPDGTVSSALLAGVYAKGRLSEICMNYLKKNREVLVSGFLVSNSSGFIRIEAEQVQFLGGKEQP